MGRERYPKARELTITAEWRRLEWNACPAVEGRVAKLATEAGLKVESALDNRHLRKGYQSQPR